jgi:hypothetical protein
VPTLPADIPGVLVGEVVGLVELCGLGEVVGGVAVVVGGATGVVGFLRFVVAGAFCVLDLGLVSSV